MTESWDGAAPTRDEDAVETDAHAESSAEELDEDRLRLDPLEAGMDPPERWSGVDKYGMTPYEQAHPRGLTDRLSEEEPDVTGGSADPVVDAAADAGIDVDTGTGIDTGVDTGVEPRSEQADELAYEGDDDTDAADPVAASAAAEFDQVDEQPGERPATDDAGIEAEELREARDRGQLADDAGGSLAAMARTADEPD
jgi:hypothetical protein